MTAALERNRLDEQPSPYLQQHADNPVHWQPWDETALEGAADRDVPIFCSIGYAACHWCHVMEEESFEDERVAERLNEDFVPIKVDREERPDVDRIYQTICQLVSGSGGWPLSVFLTPDGRPFFVGTYYPPEAKRGQPGFIDLLDQLKASWEQDRESIEERADQWHEALQQELESTGGQPQRTRDVTIEPVADAAVRSADRSHGGFGEQGPKFPQPQRIEVLLRAYARTNQEQYRTVACEALDAMADRGLYDHLGGGFHRYATDRAWEVPHFEKMLYDNAELPRVYLRGYQVTGRDRYADVVEETLSFVSRELQHPDGGFYSTLDAQSEGQEGAFYVWTPDQVNAALEEDTTASLVCDRFGITADGNFEGGTTVLARRRSVQDVAETYEMSEQAVRETLAAARETLFDVRERRPRPARDEKVLAGWNGLMISAFAEAGLILDEAYVETAGKALSFLREQLWDPDTTRLSRRFKAGDVGVTGYLDDYAYLARGAFDTYQSDGDPAWLQWAIDLADAIVEEFWDAETETLYYTPASGESLISRPQDAYDQSTPSSLAVALGVLARLDHFAPDRAYGDIVDRVLASYGSAISGSPLQHVSLAMVDDFVNEGPLEWTIVAEELPAAWRRQIASTYQPGRIAARRPPDEATLQRWIDDLGLSETPPIWRDRTQQEGQPTAYLCRDFTCSPPLTDPSEAETWLDRLDPRSSGN